jgi:prenyltransferase beta subunit
VTLAAEDDPLLPPLSRRGWLRRIAGAALAGLAPLNMPWGLASPPAVGDPLCDPQTLRAIARGMQHIAALQTDRGDFRTPHWGANVAICGLAGLAWLSLGLRPGLSREAEPLLATCRYLKRCSREDGMVIAPSASSHGPMYGHGFATLCLAEVHGSSPHVEVRGELERAVELILRSQNQAGGWRYDPFPDQADVSVSVCQLMALRAARNAGVYVPAAAVERGVAYLLSCQNRDGGFRYQPEAAPSSRFPLSAAAVVALFNAGEDYPELTTAIDYLQRQFAVRLRPDGSPHYLYAHYYSLQAFRHIGGPLWRQAYTDLRDVLLEQQRGDGSWFEHPCSLYATAMACLILNLPRSVLPIFQP